MTERDPEALRDYLTERDISCPKCGYNLRGLTGDTCPECGSIIRLEVVASDEGWFERHWLSIASSPIGMALTLAMGMGLIWVDRAAAAIVLMWTGVMAFARYWRWTRPFMAQSGLSAEARRRRGLVVTMGGLLLVAATFVAVMMITEWRV